MFRLLFERTISRNMSRLLRWGVQILGKCVARNLPLSIFDQIIWRHSWISIVYFAQILRIFHIRLIWMCLQKWFARMVASYIFRWHMVSLAYICLYVNNPFNEADSTEREVFIFIFITDDIVWIYGNIQIRSIVIRYITLSDVHAFIYSFDCRNAMYFVGVSSVANVMWGWLH